MLAILRRHRQRLGRSVLGLFALAWATVALQPCATAQEQVPAPAPVVMDHAAMGHMMPMEGMDHGAMHHGAEQKDPCPAGTDCPVFKAVDDQAAAKAADSFDLPLQLPPALVLSFPVPLFPVTPVAVATAELHTPLPAPPILEFRVLLI